jgi:hypothetical protein
MADRSGFKPQSEATAFQAVEYSLEPALQGARHPSVSNFWSSFPCAARCSDEFLDTKGYEDFLPSVQSGLA